MFFWIFSGCIKSQVVCGNSHASYYFFFQQIVSLPKMQSCWRAAYIRAPLGRLNTALVQRVWQIEPLPYVFRAPKGLNWLVRAVYWPYEFTLSCRLSRWNTRTGSDCYYIANPWRRGSSLWRINKGDGPYSTSAQLLTFRGGEIVTSV